jgi:hypothetical protein
MQELQANIEPLLHKYGVQLGFNGHFHNVQRQAAVYQNKVVQNATIVINADGDPVATHVNAEATVWMVIGTAGMCSTVDFHHCIQNDVRFQSGQQPSPPSKFYAWSEMALLNVNGFAVIEAVNASYLYWEWINSANNQVQDRMTLVQTKSPDMNMDDTTSHHDDELNSFAIVGIVTSAVTVVICVVICWYLKKLLDNRASASRFSTNAFGANSIQNGAMLSSLTRDTNVATTTQSFASAILSGDSRQTITNTQSMSARSDHSFMSTATLGNGRPTSHLVQAQRPSNSVRSPMVDNNSPYDNDIL